jgi:hypothetical protein
MRKNIAVIILLFLTIVSAMPAIASWRKWEFVNPAHIEVKAWCEKKEIIAGDVATFTIQIRNRTDQTINVFFPTGQRWDYAVYHNDVQIYRWSQGLEWAEAPHSVPLKAGETLSKTMRWQSLDRLGRALPQGVYRIHGMLMTKPRHLVSNTFSLRLLPPEIKKQEIINAKLHSFFEVAVPRFSRRQELKWEILYVYNDNRISVHRVRKTEKEIIITFMAKRAGHVDFHLYGRDSHKSFGESVERRSYRVEVK